MDPGICLSFSVSPDSKLSLFVLPARESQVTHGRPIPAFSLSAFSRAILAFSTFEDLKKEESIAL